MADVKSIPAIEAISKLLEAYGIGVRAGVLTPCAEDETSFRAILGLPAMPESVSKDWKESAGVRRPITLQKPAATGGTEDPEPDAYQQQLKEF